MTQWRSTAALYNAALYKFSGGNFGTKKEREEREAEGDSRRPIGRRNISRGQLKVMKGGRVARDGGGRLSLSPHGALA